MNYNNAFADMFKNSPFTDMFKNADMFKGADMFKNVDALKKMMDFNQVFSTQRRNIEAMSEINQIAVENTQALSRRQAEIARESVESALKASKELMTSGASPEASASKSAKAAREFFENTLSNLREMTEMVTKSGFEAFDVMNRRASESFDEMSNVAAKAAPSAKKGSK
jgi:phasin family protein